MQQSAQEHAAHSRPISLHVDTAMGMPQSESTLLAEGESIADSDFLAAISCALYTHATSMSKALDRGALQAIECYLSDGSVITHRASACGDLHITETPGLLNLAT